MSRTVKISFFAFIALAGVPVIAAPQKVDFRKPYTAIAEASKAIESKTGVDNSFFFDAAIAADWTGNSVQARNFLSYYLSQEKTSTTTVKRALVRLIYAGAAPEYYERYLKSFPKDNDAVYLGHILLRKYANDGKTRDFKKILELLINTFPSGSPFHTTMLIVKDLVFTANIQGINDGKIVVKALTSAKGWKVNPIVDNFLWELHRRNMCRQEIYQLYREKRDLRWGAYLLDNVATNPNVPDSTSLEALKRKLLEYGSTEKDIVRHLSGNYNGRFAKTPEWGRFINDVKSGKFVVPKEPKYPDINQYWRELEKWISNYYSKKIAGASALEALGEILNKSKYWYFIDQDKLFQAIKAARAILSSSPKMHAAFPFEGFAKIFLDQTIVPNVVCVGHLLDSYAKAGRFAEGINRIKASAAAMGAATACASYRYALPVACTASENPHREWLFRNGGSYDWSKKKLTVPERERNATKYCLEFFAKYGANPVPELVRVPDRVGVSWDSVWRCEAGAKNANRPMSAEEQEFFDDATKLVRGFSEKFYSRGASRTSWGTGIDTPVEVLVYSPSAKILSDPALPFLIASTETTGRRNHSKSVLDFAHALITNNCPELAYMILSTNPEKDKVPQMQRLITEAMQKMPGLYPVNEKDPSYPLYLAAEALQRNNPERAWSLLSSNLKVFDQDPLRYPPSFVLWALDQYRKVRGEDDVLRDKAWNHVEKLLAKEASLTADVAAGLFLLRARIAEDRMEYEVAHTGYMQLRNHAVYRKTASGRQAMFRDVELMISMGSLDAASQTAEQWISTPDDEIRAQGHYILAKIAFQRKDYDAVRKELDKVFEIDFTHSEGRLLQGEWKLATNYEVDDTQVLLGDLSDRSVIRPGQPLSVSVKDRNLSVAGAGASIPVIVKTSKGADVERVLLYPGTRDPSLFRGSVDTEVGIAKVGDHRLQMAGDDIVSYEIDPEFMKNRGIKKTQVKKLSVVDDASLTIGFFSDEDSDRPSHIKPGVALPVEVVDRDRSRFDAPNSLNVVIRTTSGDEIAAAKLPEIGRCTGVYRTNIVTRIPPPRAFASDSLAGMGPEDLISTVRNGKWRSMADGQKPKFIGVDTMSSHMIKSAAVEMPAPETVAEIKFWGSVMGGEEVLLGTYPQQVKDSRLGINLVQVESRTRNRTEFIRELSTRLVKPNKLANLGVRRLNNPENLWRRYRVRGNVYSETGKTMRLRLRPVNKSRDNFVYLSCSFYIDGKLVWNSPSDRSAKFKPFNLEIPAGVHTIELYGNTMRKSDEFDVCVVKEDGELELFPNEMFDANLHPEIARHLEDKCKVLRTPRGYSATFEEPMRLRSVKWEFVDFTGMSLEATKLNIDTAEGNRIIPSERDFTESLGNDTLEVAPGDTITVTYQDDITSSGKARALERKIYTMFSDGAIKFLHESTRQDSRGFIITTHEPAYRVSPGDVVTICVEEPDLNVTKGVDKMKVLVTTTGGERLVVTAKEKISITADGREVITDYHQGKFYARLRTRSKPFAEGEKRPEDILILRPGETIEAAYKDEDNTHPGVPFVRKARLSPVLEDSPIDMKLSHTYVRRVIDKSPEGQVRLKSVQRRGYPLAKATWRDVEGKKSVTENTEVALITPQSKLPVQVYAPRFAKHKGSTVIVEAISKSEIQAAEAENRMPEWRQFTFKLSTSNDRRLKAAQPSTFDGSIELYSTAFEEKAASATEEYSDEEIKPVDIKAGDELIVRLCGDGGNVLAQSTAIVSTTAWMGLCDTTYNASLSDIHLGESFHVMVIDPDRDVSDEQDSVSISVSSAAGDKCEVELKETLGRSGVFTGNIQTDIKVLSETNTVYSASRFPTKYGEKFFMSYADETASFGSTSSVIRLEGAILPGSDGDVRSYSKRFRDANQAVLVQFRMAECLFEMAKDFRKLKNAEKSAQSIAEGKAILEAALRDYPNSAHAAEGEFLLANLYEQLGEEERQQRQQREKDGEDLKNEPDKADPLFREAVARFSAILSAWPEGEYAARSQYHKALCLERLGDYSKASEEYVKMTYLFPESPHVGDAAVRLASHYYRRENRFDIAGKIYSSFRTRFPSHPQAPSALFMAGQCLVKQAEIICQKAREEAKAKKLRYMMPPLARDTYKDAVDQFAALVESYKDIQNKDLLAQGLYWAGDISFRIEDYANAYIYLKRTTFEYPESKSARFARGMLLQNSQAFDVVNE